MNSDLNFVLSETKDLWNEFRGKRIFLTGGTGFFGTCLLETFAGAEDRLGLGLRVFVLSRDPDAFKRRNPHLGGHPAFEFVKGDMTDFLFPPGEFSHVLHAATDPNVERNSNGTQRTLEFARASGAKKFLLTSSGAVYGLQPHDLKQISEDYSGAPGSLSAYGEGKRIAEQLCAQYQRQYGLETKIARCFAFVGPHLPLEGSFAMGNFIRDGLENKTIQISGDGTPYRSYLYEAELVAWLLTLLVKGKAGHAYNVGSGSEITIHQLADDIAEIFHVKVAVAKSPVPGKSPDRYVPDVTRIQKDLGLVQKISLQDGLERTIRWHREHRGTPVNR